MSSAISPEQQEVLDLLPRLSAPPEEPVPSGASEHELSDCEQRLGLAFPDKLRAWLHVCNGPCVGPGGVVGIRTRRKSQDVENLLALRPEWLAKAWIPIASDGCGNYYVVASKREFGNGEPVVFIDTMDDALTPVYIAASDTWRFLKFLFRKELGESNWPYDRNEVESEDPEILSFHDVTLPWNA